MQLADLKPNPKNPRKVTDKKLKSLKKSIEEFGDLSGIIFNKRTGQLIGGHQRIACFREGKIVGDFIELDNRIKLSYREVDWDEDKEKAANIAANKGAGEWDWDGLKDWFQELDSTGFDLDLTMFDEDERKDFFKEPEVYPEGLTDPDSVPENVETRCKPGDLWLLGNHRLLCGDSTDVLQVERLMGGEKADMVFTDPPYGVDYSGGIQFTDNGVQKNNRTKLKNDESTEIYKEVVPILAIFCDGPIYTWYADGEKSLQLYQSIHDCKGQIHAIIIWHKINARYGALNQQYKQRHEPCVYWKAKGKNLKWIGETTEATLWEMKRESKNDLHPTQKPVELAERAIRNHDAPKVLDLFLGSGSTLIACEKTKRECYGMEIDPHYCDIIIERWEKFTGQQAVLVGSEQDKMQS